VDCSFFDSRGRFCLQLFNNLSLEKFGEEDMAQWVTCRVNMAGPAFDGGETPAPVIYINLTDVAGSFTSYWFFAADNSKSQMLAVALAAISVQAPVSVNLEDPQPGNSPYTRINRLYINAG
jgi:hypothetical protein